MADTDIPQEAVSSKGRSSRKAQAVSGPLLVSNLDWTVEEVQETRARLTTLEEDWDAPGMEAYDAL
jgi:hypothetical protein